MDSRAYVSQFSTDGSLFIAAFQGSHIRIYNVEKGWKVHKDILTKSLRWTVTDTSLSPVFANMSPIVHIVDVGSGATESHANVTFEMLVFLHGIHDGLDFSTAEDGGYSFGMFSVKFSTDGRELVAGSSDDSIYVYDLEANRGGDDNLCKVWDRRCFIGRDKAAGVLVGHLEGVTFIDTRGDGRYFISNGKDQTIKLWDIRKMSATPPHAKCMEYPPESINLKHPFDQSVSTYKGQSVLRTLIRCYFSPLHSTGSNDSSVYIYDLVSGDKVVVLKHHSSPIRDCTWHPHYPTIKSSSWDGDLVKWEFPGSGEAPIMSNKRVRRRHFYY
ncbi:LEC14B protein-like [Brassica napus]|uniref:LEC14B protein-like n=1 Tax=Brassica napus TaxID=3708 RepID=UPI0020784CCF|nr:LEC14B protein-like [Brassica napus]